MSEREPPAPKTAFDVLLALASDLERSLTPIVDASLASIAEVAFVQGTMNPYEIRGVVVPPSSGHFLHVCLNVTSDRVQGTVVLELQTASGEVLSTGSTALTLPATTPRRPRAIGLVSLVFAVAAELDWSAAASAKLSLLVG